MTGGCFPRSLGKKSLLLCKKNATGSLANCAILRGSGNLVLILTMKLPFSFSSVILLSLTTTDLLMSSVYPLSYLTTKLSSLYFLLTFLSSFSSFFSWKVQFLTLLAFLIFCMWQSCFSCQYCLSKMISHISLAFLVLFARIL